MISFRALRGRRQRLLLAGLVVVMLASISAGVALTHRDRLPKDAALKVGDTVVSKEQLQRRVDVLQALYGVKEPRDAQQQDRFRRDVAKAIAVSIVLEDAARDRNVVVADQAARATLTRLIQKEFPGQGHDAFVQAMGNVGVSEREVLDEIKRQMVVSRLFDEVTAGVSVDDGQVRREYEADRKDMVVPARRRLSNIVVSERRAAQAIIRQARSGQPFAALVRTYSLDGSTRRSGGDLGYMAAKDLEPAYAQAAFSTPANNFFGPVKTRFGWNVGEVTGVKPARPMTFADVRDELRSRLQTEKALEVWRAWVSKRIKDADVTYAAAYLPADPDSAPSNGPASGLSDGLESPAQ